MERSKSGAAQRLCQRGRKLRVDQKQQDLLRRDDGVVSLARGKGQHSIDISAFEVGILLKDHLSRLAGRHQAKNIRDRNAQAANAWAAMHAIGVDRYSFQQVGNWQCHFLTIAPCEPFVSRADSVDPIRR